MNGFDSQQRKTGAWEEADPHGGVVTGEYVAGLRQGQWRHMFRDGGVRSECHYVDGELTGACTWYRQAGGMLQKGEFLDGEKHGFWQKWTEAGVLIDEGNFDRGSKSGQWTYYNPDGTVKKVTTHRSKQSG